MIVFSTFSILWIYFLKKFRHLISSTRFIFNYAEAYWRGLGDYYREWARHGLQFTEEVRNSLIGLQQIVGGRNQSLA